MKKRAFLLLTSIGLANVGEWIYFIGLNMMILNAGNSAFTVGLLYIIRPIGDICTNLFCSPIIDQLSKKASMVWLTVFRGLFVGSLLLYQELWFIYLIVLAIQICSSIYEPVSLGYITLAIPKQQLKKFNAWHNLVHSGGFLIGPAIAGILLNLGTPLLTILINSLALFLSALCLYSLPYVYSLRQERSIPYVKEVQRGYDFFKEYFLNNRQIVLFYLFVSSLSIFAAGLDSVEAAFSKNVLHMSDSQYGMMVSISGAGFLIGSLCNSLFIATLTLRTQIIGGSIVYVLGYLALSTATAHFVAGIGFFFISFALAFIHTGFRTFVQLSFPSDKIGQLTASFSMFNSLIEMFLVAVVSGLASLIDMRVTLIVTECLMVVIVGYIAYLAVKLEVLDK
uniref:MFS transporter n=1 Tax=Candidatus Enterococcus willemsii TaxID=1857215 RepID=UPI00403F15DF